MKPVSLIRFDALAAYARHPKARAYGEELAWFEHADERVLGALIRDRIDNDFAGVVFARDELLQYRWTRMTGFDGRRRWAQALLRQAMEQAALAPDEEHFQGHPRRPIVDFFKPVVADARLHKTFRRLTRCETYSPALGIIEPMMRWYQDVDGNFVEQFQSTGFDQRMWELYLFATLVELGFDIDRSHPAPDFVCESLVGAIAIEAVTVNPSRDGAGNIVEPPVPGTPQEIDDFLRNYMPIRFGSALYSKLQKAYWRHPHMSGKPFVIAIEDFSSEGSMIFTRSALDLYLYGVDHRASRDEDGMPVVTPQRVEKHVWGAKEIPSGFFFLPGAENISAVLFSNSGTIAKFNRMGLLAGFGSRRVRMVREGFAYDFDPKALAPKAFRHDVNDPGYAERWAEGIDVFHNPRALHPLDPNLLPNVGHHFAGPDGTMSNLLPPWHPLSSRTFISLAD